MPRNTVCIYANDRYILAGSHENELFIAEKATTIRAHAERWIQAPQPKPQRSFSILDENSGLFSAKCGPQWFENIISEPFRMDLRAT